MAAGLYSMRSAILRIETFLKPLGDEQLARRVEDRAADRLAVAFLSFFDAHDMNSPGDVLNSVHQFNIVRRGNNVLRFNDS